MRLCGEASPGCGAVLEILVALGVAAAPSDSGEGQRLRAPAALRSYAPADFAAVAPRIAELDPPMPETIYLVRTSGDEEEH